MSGTPQVQGHKSGTPSHSRCRMKSYTAWPVNAKQWEEIALERAPLRDT